MTQTSPENWPPVIVDIRLPATVVWRDRICTAAMWLLLFWLCRHPFISLWNDLYDPLVRGHEALTRWWVDFYPYFILIGLLGIWLVVSGIISLRRRARSLRLPQPASLTLEEEARRAHCTPDDLARWRELKVCTVHLKPDDRFDVVPGSKSG